MFSSVVPSSLEAIFYHDTSKLALRSSDSFFSLNRRADLLGLIRQGSARRKSCAACTDSKVKCDREVPCGKCKTKGKECVYPATRRRASRIPSHAVSQDILSLGPGDISEFGPAHLVPHAGPSEFSYNPALHSSPAPLDPGVASGSAVSSRYHTDIFQPFFASVFGSADSPPSDHSQPNPFGADAFPFATNSLSSNIFAGGQYPSGFPDMHPGRSLQAPVSNLRGSPTTIVATTSSSDSSSTPETEYYGTYSRIQATDQ